MIHLKPVLLFLVLVFSSQPIFASKSHLEHPKYKQSSSDLIKNRHIIKFSKGHDTGLSDTFLESFHREFSNVNIKKLYNYKSSVFHGLSIHIDAPNNQVYSNVLNAMMNHPDVASMHSQYKMKHSGVNFATSGIDLATDPTDLINPHHMTQVKRVHDELQNRGQGIFIGVIDSGIDYNHPALGGGFGEGYKVVAGYDLVGDDYNPDDDVGPTEDDDPFDNCPKINGGHGTHVSGIIAGYDPVRKFSGVAPNATLGMWRVFSCGYKSVNDDTILEALVRAYEAGVDVINISIGGSTSWSASAVNQAIDNIVSHGVVVVIAGGNSGSDAMYTSGDIAKAESAISVASVENDFFYGPNFKASGIDTLIPYTLSHGNTKHFPDHSIPMVLQYYRNATLDSTDLCSEKNMVFTDNTIKNSLVLVDSEYAQCLDFISEMAKENDAYGIIVFNTDNAFSGAVQPIDVNITTLFISLDYGTALKQRFQDGGNVRIKLSSTQDKSYLNQNLVGGTVSTFSSIGPSAELLFKPEIAGVGGAILSTVPLKAGGWEISQGTSMASPYIAGSIGLYLAAHGKKAKENPSLIKTKFMNYAKPVSVYKSQSLDSPLRQGAGLVQVYDAITQTAAVSPPKISFNDTATDLYKTHSLTIDNLGEEEVTYRLHNNVSVSLMAFNKSDDASYYSAPVAVIASAGITFSTDFIQVPPHTSVNVSVTVDLSDETLISNHLYYGGFIQFESQNDNNKDISVPYFGVYGRQKELHIFSPVIPLSLNDTATGTIYQNTNKKGFKFDASRNDSIIINVSITTPTSFLKCELLDEQGQVRGYVPISDSSEYDGSVNQYNVDRNEGTELYYQYEVDSRYVPTDLLIANVGLAEIQYKGVGYYKMSALKLFGDAQVEDDWEVWVSGPVEFV